MGNGLARKTRARDEGAAGYAMKPAARLPLTAECKHYTSVDQVPGDIQK